MTTLIEELRTIISDDGSLDEGATPGGRSKGTGYGRGEKSAAGEFWDKFDKMDSHQGRKNRFNRAQRRGKKKHIDAQLRGESIADELEASLSAEE